MLGNAISVLFPYRMRRDAANAQANRPRVFLVSFLVLPGLSVLVAPSVGLLVLEHYFGAVVLIPAALLLALTTLLYRTTLPAAGRLLLDREQRVLAAFAKDRD